jgi:hypothetical protein
MRERLRRRLVFTSLLVLLIGVAACNKNKSSDQASQGSGNAAGSPPGMTGGPGGGPGGSHGPIGEIMAKLTKGPQSLTNVLGRELKEEPPPWDKIQPQTKEYAQLAASMSKYDPPKGDKESWTKLTGSFSKSATDLEHAAEAKNKTDALAAHQALTTSCKACHDAHRPGPGGRGGLPPGGFRGPGGPPRPPQ